PGAAAVAGLVESRTNATLRPRARKSAWAFLEVVTPTGDTRNPWGRTVVFTVGSLRSLPAVLVGRGRRGRPRGAVVNDLPRDPDREPDEPERDNDPDQMGSAQNPMAAMFAMDPTQLGAVFQHLGRMLASGDSGPVNWDFARDMARQTVSAAGDTSVSDTEKRAVADAVQLAAHWLHRSE